MEAIGARGRRRSATPSPTLCHGYSRLTQSINLSATEHSTVHVGANVDTLSAADRYIDQLFAKVDKDLSGALKFEEFLPIADEVMRAMGPSGEAN